MIRSAPRFHQAAAEASWGEPPALPCCRRCARWRPPGPGRGVWRREIRLPGRVHPAPARQGPVGGQSREAGRLHPARQPGRVPRRPARWVAGPRPAPSTSTPPGRRRSGSGPRRRPQPGLPARRTAARRCLRRAVAGRRRCARRGCRTRPRRGRHVPRAPPSRHPAIGLGWREDAGDGPVDPGVAILPKAVFAEDVLGTPKGADGDIG